MREENDVSNHLLRNLERIPPENCIFNYVCNIGSLSTCLYDHLKHIHRFMLSLIFLGTDIKLGSVIIAV